MNQLPDLALVACGGALGATLRFLISRWCDSIAPTLKFPVATLGVNIAGCLLIGILAGLSSRTEISPALRLLIVTGILGGFTTFSAFGLETISLLRTGHASSALVYVFCSVVGGCGAVMVGLYLSDAKP